MLSAGQCDNAQTMEKNVFRNESGIITTDPMEIIKRIKQEYYEQLQAHKFDNSDDMDQFLERHKLLKTHTRRNG